MQESSSKIMKLNASQVAVGVPVPLIYPKHVNGFEVQKPSVLDSSVLIFLSGKRLSRLYIFLDEQRFFSVKLLLSLSDCTDNL